MITVKKLKELLSEINDDTLVVVNGYESGFDKVTNVKLIMVKDEIEPECWDGELEKVNNGHGEVVVALTSSRRS